MVFSLRQNGILESSVRANAPQVNAWERREEGWSGTGARSITAVTFHKSRCWVLRLLLAAMLLAGCELQATPDAIAFLRKPSPQHIRVISYNVNWDSIFPNGDPRNHSLRAADRSAQFVRIVKAVQPDVVCLQEINPDRDPQQVASILDSALPLANSRKWQVHRGQDNVIAARYPLHMRADDVMLDPTARNYDHLPLAVDVLPVE